MSPPPAGSRPICSMTGFARQRGRAGDALGWTLSIKAVNHRFLDLHLRMPAGAESLEMQLRRGLKDALVRGHLEVTLTLERAAAHGVELDPALLRGYLEAFRAAAAASGLAEQPSLSALLQLPGVLRGATAAGGAELRAAEMEQVELPVLQALPRLIAELQAMRAEEGAALAAELRAILGRILEAVDRLARLHPLMQAAHLERTRARIEAMLGGAAAPERLLQEAAILADRSDVSEEIARLRAHVDHFRGILDRGGELGKKLDFLLQEMNREANTLLSKVSGIAGAGAEVTGIGLALKAEVEKAREQVQNLE